MKTTKQTITSLGILLGMTTLLGIGVASLKDLSQPVRASASQSEIIESNPEETSKSINSIEESSVEVEEPVTEESSVEVEEPVTEESSVEVEESVTEDPETGDESSPNQESVVVSEEVSSENLETIQAPMTINILGKIISYQNGGTLFGQSIIDSNSNISSTWGGSAIQSGNDGLNTHFIGHNPGVFSAVFSLNFGDVISITDEYGIPSNYIVSSIFTVDDSAIGSADKINYYDIITGTTGGERITLQTCVDDYTNLIVIAYS